MSFRKFTHPAAAIGAAVVAFGAFSACSSSERSVAPQPASDGWAEQTVVSMQVRSQLVVPQLPALSRTDTIVQQPLFTSPRTFPTLKDGHNRLTRIQHFRDQSGVLHSVAAVYENDGQPARTVFAFANGRIRFILASQYARHGNVWVRRRSKTTTFDDKGKVTAQVVMDATTASANALLDLRTTPRVPSDATAALTADPLDSGTCSSEWTLYSLASLALAVAALELAALTQACFEGNFIACGKIKAAIGAVTAATLAWNSTLDKLVLCRELSSGDDDSMTGGSYGGGGGAGGAGSGSGATPDDNLINTIKTFIDKSIDSGNYACVDDGNDCIFFGA